MLDFLIASALFVGSLQSPPAAPASRPATQPASAPILSGPDATEAGSDKPTLVQRTFDGSVENIGPEPDYVAIGMLDLTPEQRAKYDEIHSTRLTAFDQIIRNNYGLVLDIASLQGETSAARRAKVFQNATEAFKPYVERGTFFQEMWPHLSDEQRRATEAMLQEYRTARTESLKRQATGAAATPRALAAVERLEAFGLMVRESIERQVGLERDAFEAIANELGLTPEQRNAAEAIFQPIAIKRFQNIEVSKAEQAAALAEFNKLLTGGQKQKAMGILLRQYQKQNPDKATTQPATAPAANATTPPEAKPGASPQAYKLAPGPFTVSERMLTFTDVSRNRDVPVKLYMPKEATGPSPVIVFSHGWGGNREGCAYLGRHWASHGYSCMMVEHDGSDTDFLRAAVGDNSAGIGLKVGKAMQDSLADTSNWSNRPLDVTFALDELNRRNGQTGDELLGELDLSRVGMSGHSFGAYTTMLIMGALVDLPGQQDRGFRDSRCVAGIAMSSQGEGRLGLDAHSWDNMTAPMLYFTGTKDLEGFTRDMAGRRAGFDHTDAGKASDQFFMVLDGGEHMAFSDNARGVTGEPITRNPRASPVDPDGDDGVLGCVHPWGRGCCSMAQKRCAEESDQRGMCRRAQVT